MAAKRALVVDSDREMRMMLGVVLRELGVASLTVATHEEGLAALNGGGFSIALVDVTQEAEQGLALIRAVRRDHTCANRRVPFLVMSGQSRRDLIEGARDSGADGFLAKPVTSQSLCARMDQAVLRRRPYIETAGYCGPDRRGAQRRDYAGPERREADNVFL